MVNSPRSPSDVRLSLRGHRRGRVSFLPIITPLKWMIVPRPCTVHNRQLASGVEMAPLLTSKRLLEPHYGRVWLTHDHSQSLGNNGNWNISFMVMRVARSDQMNCARRLLRGLIVSTRQSFSVIWFCIFFYNETIRKLWREGRRGHGAPGQLYCIFVAVSSSVMHAVLIA